jgi:hypothetical protein
MTSAFSVTFDLVLPRGNSRPYSDSPFVPGAFGELDATCARQFT